MLRTWRRTAALLAVGVILFSPATVAAQGRQTADMQAFFDAIHAPNWLGTDIAHTAIKQQRGGTCWDFATVSFLESEVLRTNEALKADPRAVRQLDLSEYFVVYWAYVEKARVFVKRKGENARVSDGGLSHDTVWLVRQYGIVPEADYKVPENYGAMSREIDGVMQAAKKEATWDEGKIVAAVREVLDRHLAPPPKTITVAGKQMTPKQYADDYLKLDYENYWEITSYTDIPLYARGELDVPDNWWDCDTYYNVPLGDYLKIMNRALDNGYSVAIDTDWGDQGAGWNTAGIAVIHPDQASPMMINADTRLQDFQEHRTTDDHLVHAVDHRVLDGQDWYLIKNSHGTGAGRRGYVWIRGDWFALRVLAIMVHKDAIDGNIVAKFAGR